MTLAAIPFAQGLAKYVEWSANMMEEEAKKKLKAAELQCKKNRVKMWANYVPPASNSKAIHDQNFTGKVIIACMNFLVKQLLSAHFTSSQFLLVCTFSR